MRASSGVCPGRAALRATLFLLIVAVGGIASESRSFFRSYKATAYVTFFGVTIFTRSDVGFGSAAERESFEDRNRTVLLQFLSGSKPERAHGLNRFGFIEETVHETDGQTEGSGYFGLITASREESLSEARAALGAKPGDKTQYVAAQARLEGTRAQFEIRHVILPLPHEPAAAMDMVKKFQSEFRDLPATAALDRDSTVTVSNLHTFLYMLVQAAGSDTPSVDSPFVYNSKPYKLHLDRKADEKTGAELVKLGLVKSSNQVMRMNGSLENEKGERTAFAFWYEARSQNLLPLRFEFRPRSYLHLVFDAVPETETSAPKVLAWR